MFNLDNWSRRWKAARDARGPGQRHDMLLLLRELAKALAATPTTPADLFDRPELVRLQEAARLV